VQQVAEVHKQISPQVPSPSFPRFPRMEIVAIIGLIGILSVALISILSWGKWFPASPGPTPAATNTAPAPTFTPALPTHTFTPALPTRTLEPSLTPTQSFTPTATPLPVEITDPKGVTMRLVPAGEFTMGRDDAGASGRVHMVYLDSYYMDVYEVTIKLYKICATAGICSIPKDTSRYNSSSYGNRPVDYVNWDQAKTYCQWRGARLPTEAEWEKAARGTDGRVYPWGAGIDCDKASYRGCVGNTTAVGSHPDGISPYGMYDMAGNVSEWVADWYGDDYYVILGDNASNPQGPSDGYYRGLRGGGWANYDYNVRSDTRYFVEPSYSNSGVGFRCAGTMP
jgi:serine/threonine-protein kinase